MNSNALGRLKAAGRRQTLTLTHYGRKSGKPYDVTIWFALEGDKVYIGTANVNRQWVRNVQKTPRIRLAVAASNSWARRVSSPNAPSVIVLWRRFDGSIGYIDHSLHWGRFSLPSA
jgi:deazaflavin-dependent oxidoreductase (nitroreductase family)